MIRRASIICLGAALAGSCLITTASAQTSDTSSPAARLSQLDATYAANLRKLHAPVIQDYLIALDKLRQTLLEKGREDSVAAALAEIDRISKISTGNGLLPYDILKLRKTEDDPDAPTPPKPVVVKPAGPSSSIILPATSAQKNSPDPATLTAQPTAKALPLGSAEWRVDKIPAGTWTVSVLYSSSGSPDTLTLNASLGEESARRVLTQTNATGGINEFRILKVGDLTLTQDASGQTLALKTADPIISNPPVIWVKQVMLARAGAGAAK